MDIAGSVVLVTGANRGMGAEYVRQLVERGASKVYAAARNADSIEAGGVVQALTLDVTDPDQVAAAADAAGDVSFVINNAGVAFGQNVVAGDLDRIRQEFEVNVFGLMAVSRAFAPVLSANGGGAILNANSALSWFSYPGAGTYSATKAASWSLTDALRVELAAQGTQVTGLHMGLVDTDMAASFDGPKVTAESVVTAALDGVEAGLLEVLADDTAAGTKSSLGLDPSQRYAEMLGAAA